MLGSETSTIIVIHLCRNSCTSESESVCACAVLETKARIHTTLQFYGYIILLHNKHTLVHAVYILCTYCAYNHYTTLIPFRIQVSVNVRIELRTPKA